MKSRQGAEQRQTTKSLRGVPSLSDGTTKFRSLNPARKRNPRAGQSIVLSIDRFANNARDDWELKNARNDSFLWFIAGSGTLGETFFFPQW